MNDSPCVSVLQSSIHRHSKRRVLIEPLILDKLPIKRRGLTEFSFSRFLVPWLCDYRGAAIFMDADIVVTGDIGELIDQADGISAVQVMQEQPKFEWSSVMLFNCAKCELLTPQYIDDESHPLLSLEWGKVGRFSKEWNFCVGYNGTADHAKFLHYTQGIPCFFETGETDVGGCWAIERKEMLRTCDWATLMAKSVHAKPVIMRLLKRYGIEVG